MFTVQIHTPNAGWVSLPYMTYASRRTAQRFAANRRKAYPAERVRIVEH